MVLPVVNATARLAVPDKVPVMVPAEKLPLASLATIALAVLDEVAVVAELLTFKAVAIVANFESIIAALLEISALVKDPVILNLEYGIAVALHTPVVIVPTLVKLDPVTLAANEVPVKVPASAVSVILPEPFAIEIPEPAVKVVLEKLPVEVPISI